MSFQDVQAKMEIATQTGFVICVFKSANVILVGLETVVMNMIVLDILHVLTMVTAATHIHENAIVAQSGLEKRVIYHVSMALTMAIRQGVCVSHVILESVVTKYVLAMVSA